MASGCILGECPVCEEFVWEDDWRFFDNIMMHPGCVPDYIKAKHGMNENQFLRLCGSQEIQQAIEDLQKTFKESMDFYNQQLLDIKDQIAKIIEVKRDENK